MIDWEEPELPGMPPRPPEPEPERDANDLPIRRCDTAGEHPKHRWGPSGEQNICFGKGNP